MYYRMVESRRWHVRPSDAPHCLNSPSLSNQPDPIAVWQLLALQIGLNISLPRVPAHSSPPPLTSKYKELTAPYSVLFWSPLSGPMQFVACYLFPYLFPSSILWALEGKNFNLFLCILSAWHSRSSVNVYLASLCLSFLFSKMGVMLSNGVLLRYK